MTDKTTTGSDAVDLDAIKPWRQRMAQYVSADRAVDAIKTAADAEVAELRALIAQARAAAPANESEQCPVCADGVIVPQISHYCTACGTAVASTAEIKANREARAAAPAATAQSAIPEGFALVPVKPTPEMIAAMQFKGDIDIAIGHANFYMEAEEDYAAMLRAAPVIAAPTAPSDYVLMPKRLTAENGAKAALMGEFKESIEVPCPECFGELEDYECETCENVGRVSQGVTVGWDTIKEIYSRAVELLVAPTATAEPVAADAEQSALSAIAHDVLMLIATTTTDPHAAQIAVENAQQFMPAAYQIRSKNSKAWTTVSRKVFDATEAKYRRKIAPQPAPVLTVEPDRKITLLRAAHELLKRQSETSEVLSLLSETVFYDDAECDGHCLMEDIEIVLNDAEDHAAAPAPQQAAPLTDAPAAAWMTEDGQRVVPAHMMEGARRDGGAMLSSLKPYTVALVRAGSAASAGDARDAARYRFLRFADLDSIAEVHWKDAEVPTGDEFDAAIDAAMAATKEK